MLIPIECVGALSFPDRRIRDFRYDGQTLRFESDGIYVDGEGLIEQRTLVACVGFGTAHSRRFINDRWVDVDPRLNGLDFIGEWSIEDKNLRLAGFDVQSGEWREYQIQIDSVNVQQA